MQSTDLGRNPEKSYASASFLNLKTHKGAKIQQEKQKSYLVSLSEYDQIVFKFIKFNDYYTLPQICAKTCCRAFRPNIEVRIKWCRVAHTFCAKHIAAFLIQFKSVMFTHVHPACNNICESLQTPVCRIYICRVYIKSLPCFCRIAKREIRLFKSKVVWIKNRDLQDLFEQWKFDDVEKDRLSRENIVFFNALSKSGKITFCDNRKTCGLSGERMRPRRQWPWR